MKLILVNLLLVFPACFSFRVLAVSVLLGVLQVANVPHAPCSRESKV